MRKIISIVILITLLFCTFSVNANADSKLLASGNADWQIADYCVNNLTHSTMIESVLFKDYATVSQQHIMTNNPDKKLCSVILKMPSGDFVDAFSGGDRLEVLCFIAQESASDEIVLNIGDFTAKQKAEKGKINHIPVPLKSFTHGNVNLQTVKADFDGNFISVGMTADSGRLDLVFSDIYISDGNHFSGNPDYPNVVWHCSLDDPSYVSDLDYYREGMDTAAIKGMVAGNNALWVFREPSDANTNVFYHTPTIDDEYGKIYPSSHSSVSIGCVGKAINFNDDIVFFSDRGMEGVSGDITTEQMAAHRSSLVDRKMIAEPDYKDMILAEWDGYLFVFIGDKAYLADSRAAFSNENHMEYEWFFWDMEKRITSARVKDGVLYLGAEDGVYTLTDNECHLESYWVTPKDKCKYPNKLKTTNKKGCVAEATGDIEVYAKVEDTGFELIGRYENVTDYFVSRVKRKKWKDIQLKFYSNTRFSLETVTLECVVGGYIKR